MGKKIINKQQQDNFLKLSIDEQIRLLNSKIQDKGTEGVSELGFSYSWISNKMNERNVFYVASIKRFIKEEKQSTFSDKEIAILREIISDYNKLSNVNEIMDIRMCAGSCGDKTTTRSIVIDSEINKQWNDFCKKNSFVNNKDLVSSAFKQFMHTYNYKEMI